MAAGAFYADERAPHRVLRGKAMPGDEARSVTCIIAAGHVGRKRQEELVQALFGKEIAH